MTCSSSFARPHRVTSTPPARLQESPKRSVAWVLIGGWFYEVGSNWVSIIAWSGSGAPAHSTFPISKGLTGSAIQRKTTVVVGDVRKDTRYLTAFGTTLSEILIPAFDPQKGNVIGTINVESDRLDAVSEQDRELLERCARSALSIWRSQS